MVPGTNMGQFRWLKSAADMSTCHELCSLLSNIPLVTFVLAHNYFYVLWPQLTFPSSAMWNVDLSDNRLIFSFLFCVKILLLTVQFKKRLEHSAVVPSGFHVHKPLLYQVWYLKSVGFCRVELINWLICWTCFLWKTTSIS